MGELIKAIFTGFTEVIKGMGAGLKDAFMTLLYEDPTAEVLKVSGLAQFLFVMMGLSMAVGIFYLIFRLIRNRG